MIFYGDNIKIGSVGSSKIFQIENVVGTEVDVCRVHLISNVVPVSSLIRKMGGFKGWLLLSA